MLSLGARQSENSLTFRTFTVYVGLSVADHISSQLEKAAEYFIFPSALSNVFRKHSEEHPEDKTY